MITKLKNNTVTQVYTKKIKDGLCLSEKNLQSFNFILYARLFFYLIDIYIGFYIRNRSVSHAIGNFWQKHVLLQMKLGDRSDRNILWHHHGIEGWSFHEFSIDSHFIASDLTAASEASGDWHSLTSPDLFGFIHDQFLVSLLQWVLSNVPFLIFLRWLGDILRLLLCHTCNARNRRLF